MAHLDTGSVRNFISGEAPNKLKLNPIRHETRYIVTYIVHGGKEYADSKCMYARETDEYEKLYSLDILGVKDRVDDHQLDVHKEFQESISKRSDGRYEVGVPGAKLSTDILLADLQKAFQQMAIKNEDRDAFRFLFKKTAKRNICVSQECLLEQKLIPSCSAQPKNWKKPKALAKSTGQKGKKRFIQRRRSVMSGTHYLIEASSREPSE